MAQTTIEQFATELKIPAGALLEQLVKAGVAGKKEGDKLSEVDKTKLLEYLQKQHGAAGEPKKKITLTRKQTTEIKAAGSMGKARTIQVEVRKKRVFVKRDETERAPPVEEAPARVAPAPLITAEELAARAAEEKKGAGAHGAPAGGNPAEAGAGGEAQDEEGKGSRGSRGEGSGRRRGGGSRQGRRSAAAEGTRSRHRRPRPRRRAKARCIGPATKPGEKARTVKKSGTAFQEEAARRRALKLRGDVTGGTATTGWRQPKVGGRAGMTRKAARRARPRRRDRSSAKSRCRKRSPSPISRTRCRSRPPSSSRR